MFSSILVAALACCELVVAAPSYSNGGVTAQSYNDNVSLPISYRSLLLTHRSVRQLATIFGLSRTDQPIRWPELQGLL
jgi:hypothetical protein